jgi:PiT family inorganic phosphate transporter
MTAQKPTMQDPSPNQRQKQTLDKDLGKFAQVEEATRLVSRGLIGPGLAFTFIAAAVVATSLIVGSQPNAIFVVVAAAVGGYMAMNIGANDSANNVGPAVGSQALTMMGALAIAAVFESSGALIAGGDVVSTIKKGIIDPALVPDTQTFILVMMAALLAAAMWVNLATYIGAPVSTTHSIVGGVLGSGISAVGFAAVNWITMTKIAASWVISPVLGGIIAAAFLAIIKINIIYQDDKIAAARRWVPVLVATMTSVFTCYLVMKGLKNVWKPDFYVVAMLGAAVFVLALGVLRPLIHRQSEGLENRNQSLRQLFKIPLICSAAMLSFAHGANDIANAIGPLAAIVHAVETGDIAAKVGIPIWVMLIGACGISLGLFLFGPRLIKVVGAEITRMNPMRAYCVALSAAITVLFASALGLPVSTTHIAIGGVFGVGFFREYYTSRSKRRQEYIQRHTRSDSLHSTAATPPDLRTRKLVRRSHFMTIIAAWLITVPSAATLSAIIFLTASLIF